MRGFDETTLYVKTPGVAGADKSPFTSMERIDKLHPAVAANISRCSDYAIRALESKTECPFSSRTTKSFAFVLPLLCATVRGSALKMASVSFL